MADDAGSYSGGVGGGGGGGNDWELVSLTASTYAAAPGPVPAPIPLDTHKKAELPRTRPAAASAIFMSQHFSLPAAEAQASILNGCQVEEEESVPDMLPRDDEGATDDLSIPCPENQVREQDGGRMTRRSDLHKDLSTTLGMGDVNLLADAGNAPLPQGGGEVPVCVAGEELQATVLCSSDAHAATDGIGIVDSASLPAHVLHVAVPSGPGVACVAPNKGHSPSRIPCEAQAWWNKTFRFPSNNSRESLLLEFNVDGEKISCGMREPSALGQVKISMLGGSPVAQG